MSKAFVKESESEDDEELDARHIPAVRNYITPSGYQRLKDELLQLLNAERPDVVKIVSWAASNGDRSENGDYIYGKKRLREIDRRIRFLTGRLDLAEVVDPAARREAAEQIFFGATVVYTDSDGQQNQVTIVGVDEVDPARGYISWISPVAAALLKAHVGDQVSLRTPGGIESLEVISVSYTNS